MSHPANTRKDTYRRLLVYAFQYKHFFAISFLGFVLYAAMQTLFFKALELFVNLLEGKTGKDDSSATASFSLLGLEDTALFSFSWMETLENSVYLLPIFIIVLSLFRGIGYFFGSFFISKIGLEVVNTLRKEVFDHLLYVPQKYHHQKSSGKQISLIIFNVEQITGAITQALKILLESGLFLIGLLIYLLNTNWQLTLVFFCVVPILSGLVFIASRYFRRISQNIQKSVGRVSHITNESIQGIHTVKSYNAEKFESSRFHKAANDNLKHGTKFQRVNALQTPIMHFVIAIALAVIFLLVLLIWPEGSAGSAVAFVSAAAATAKPTKQLSTINAIIQRGLAAAETVFEALDEPREKNTGTQPLGRARGAIAFKQLGFAYTPDKPVLKSLDLVIKPGETVALVGQSGSGKTTIANLLLRFYDGNTGELRIDGHDIHDIKLNDLRSNISFVSQAPMLFEASVAENVCYGAADIDEARLKQALINANAMLFVEDLEDGVNANVGEGGSRLSGGQQQRIAIARALYKDAPILILDEATSALDNESEQQIQSALARLKQGRTTLIIAHRLTTVKDADKIVVLKQGEVVEMGTHDELLQQQGSYANLYHNQAPLS